MRVCDCACVCVRTWVIMSWEKLLVLKIYGNDWLGWGTSICGRESAPLINQTNSCSPNFGIHLIWKWPLRIIHNNSMVIRFGGSCLSGDGNEKRSSASHRPHLKPPCGPSGKSQPRSRSWWFGSWNASGVKSYPKRMMKQCLFVKVFHAQFQA